MQNKDISKLLKDRMNVAYSSTAEYTAKTGIQEFSEDFWKSYFKIIYPKPEDTSQEEYDNFVSKMVQTKFETIQSLMEYRSMVKSIDKMIVELRHDREKYSHKMSREWFVSDESYKLFHDNLNEKFILKSDDEYIDLLINVWLKRQITLGKTWGRVYGKGFRDIMQDTSSFLSLDPVFAKEKIKHTLSYQFENGNTIRQFDPIFDYPYQDGPSWIPATVLAYLKETNDFFPSPSFTEATFDSSR